jgi:cell division protein FtsB
VRLEKLAEHKVVGQKIAIALGAACIALAVGLVVAIVFYLPASGQINSLNAQIAQKDQSITALNAQITALSSQVNSLNSQNPTSDQTSMQNEINGLNAQIQSLYNVIYMNASATLVSAQTFTVGPNTTIVVWDQPDTPLLYAGYVTVQVQSSSSNTTFVEMAYDSFGVLYDNVVTIGNEGTVSFPVVPGPVTIVLGNTELNSAVTGTVAASYHY